MRRGALALVLALSALAAVGCTSPKSKACRAVCARESECNGDKPSEATSFDEAECVAACAALESDKNPFISGLVTKRAECLKTTTSCPEYQTCTGK
ncbi:MAG: hypothetical protein R3B06_02405 [Kofleriaceae bacterium]